MIILNRKTLLALSLLVFALSVWYAANLDMSAFLTDDGGITMRYAERIATGQGFNYNAGEAVNGASNPLYTLVLAGFLALGLSPKVAILTIAIPAAAATSALLFYAFARYWSLFAALVCIPAFWGSEFVLSYQFDALEPTLTCLFAALLFLSLNGDNRIFQGIALGLLVANKLDGAFAPIAFTIAWLFLERRFPWRQAVSALAAAAPTFVILLIAFGSVVPNSMLTKIHAETPGGFNPMWMIDHLRFNLPMLFFPALLSFLLPVAPTGRLARSAIQIWLVLTLTAYAMIDLGDPYPWYVVLPAFLLVILAVITAHSAYHGFSTIAAPQPSGTLVSHRLSRVLGVAALLAYGIYEPRRVMVGRLQDEQKNNRVTAPYAAEIARAACGAWLRKYTDGTEVLWSHFGLPSYEYKGPVFDGSLLNSSPDPDALGRAAYSIMGPFNSNEKPDAVFVGKELVGVFRYEAQAHAYALYARSDSQIARSGHSHFRDPFELQDPITGPGSPAAVLGKDYQFANGTLQQRVPSELIFTLELPSDSPLSFTPEPPRRQAGRRGAVAWSVKLDGEEVAHGELRFGDSAQPQHVRFSHPSPDGRHLVAFSAVSLDPSDAALRFVWTDVAAAVASPLSSADFHAICEPWARVIDGIEGAH